MLDSFAQIAVSLTVIGAINANGKKPSIRPLADNIYALQEVFFYIGTTRHAQDNGQRPRRTDARIGEQSGDALAIPALKGHAFKRDIAVRPAFYGAGIERIAKMGNGKSLA